MKEILLFLLLGLFALWFFVIGPAIKKDLAENKQKEETAVANSAALIREFFDGSKSKIWKGTDNYLPAENMIAGAVENGYRVASREGTGLSTTIVFERV